MLIFYVFVFDLTANRNHYKIIIVFVFYRILQQQAEEREKLETEREGQDCRKKGKQRRME